MGASLNDPYRPVSILHVVAPARFGGLESVVRLLARGHRARGHATRIAAVLASGGDDHPFVAAARADGTDVSVLQVATRSYRRERALVRGLCHLHHVDVVHTHGYRPDVVDGEIARRDGIRTVSTVHGFIGGGPRGRVYEWLQRRALRRFDAVAAVSRPIASRLLAAGVPTDRLHLVPNAFLPREDLLSRTAARALLGLPRRARIVGWVGRLGTEKGPDVALRALARCRLGDVELAMLGDGRERGGLEALAASLGIAHRVHWLGAVPEAGAVFAAFDAFLLSSRTEGTPVVLLEAMAAGVPAIVTRVGGVPDVVGEAEAWTAPSEDVEALAEAIAGRFDHPELAAQRAAAARTRLDRTLALGPWLAQYEAMYHPPLR